MGWGMFWHDGQHYELSQVFQLLRHPLSLRVIIYQRIKRTFGRNATVLGFGKVTV